MLRVGLKLMIEVLDHYRGPDHKFRWLIAFAESANERTRTGWPSRKLMSWRTQKSEARVSNIASELVDDGVLKRDGGGGRHRGNARYTLLPFTAQSSPVTNPDNVSQGSPSTNPKGEVKGSPGESQGSPAANFQGSRPILLPAETSLPNPSVSPQSPQTTGAATAQTVLASFIDWDRDNGGTLTQRTIGQLAKQIAHLLGEGIDDRYIRIGLADWRAKGQHPATLDSFVNAAMNGRGAGRHRRQSTGDRRLAEAEDLKAQLRDQKELA